MNLQSLLSNTASDRNALKPSFNRGQIPTQEDFHALIDALYRLRDDSIYKDADNGLCIKAGTDGDKTALLLYDDFNDPKWTMSVREGFHLKDENNNKRFTISNITGYVGINNPDPKEAFQIGDRWTFHSGGTKYIGYNATWDPSSGTDRRLANGPSSQIRMKGDITLLTAESGNSNTSLSAIHRMILKNDGSVGIGVSQSESLRGKLHVNGDIFFRNRALISHVDPNNPTSNIDHIWHDDTNTQGVIGIWHFVSDGAYKSSGSSRLQAGNIHMTDSAKSNYLASNVGIGTDDPQKKLHVKGNGGLFRLEGSNHVYIEFYPDGPSTRKGWIGYNTGSEGDNLTITNEIANANINLNAKKVLFKGIAVHGSDERLKKNISIDLAFSALEKISSVQPVKYHYKEESDKEPQKIGVLAQEIKKVLPDAVIENKNENRTLYVDYQYINMVTLQAVKELKDELNNIKKKLAN